MVSSRAAAAAASAIAIMMIVIFQTWYSGVSQGLLTTLFDVWTKGSFHTMHAVFQSWKLEIRRRERRGEKRI